MAANPLYDKIAKPKDGWYCGIALWQNNTSQALLFVPIPFDATGYTITASQPQVVGDLGVPLTVDSVGLMYNSGVRVNVTGNISSAYNRLCAVYLYFA